MATITEDYVSFETANLLKEKGFDTPCDYAYNNKAGYFEVDRSDFDEVYCFRPSLAMATKWLREVHGLFVSISNDDLDYNWQIFDMWNRTKDLDLICLTDSYGGYRKYEQACEAAIKYCLENLI